LHRSSTPYSDRRRVRWLGAALILAALCVFAEGAAFVFYRTVILTSAPFLAYTPPRDITREEFERYGRIRDDFLGWPMAYNDPRAEQFDPSGARPSPAFPRPGDECISLYGDSFVYGSEVSDAETWGNLLSQRVGCRVGNFGVGGYGTDQAYMRFRRNARDSAPVSIVGIYSDNALRNVNQYRFLLTGVREEVYGFKPRLVLEDGRLRLVPLPTLAYDDLAAFFAEPARFLGHEDFLPDTPYGPVRFHFPYVVSLLRAVGKERARRWLSGVPSSKGFLEPRHPTGSMELTVAIAVAFHDHCRERGRVCLVVVFPTPSAYEFLAKTGELVTRPLGQALAERGVRVLDLTAPLMRALGGGPLCSVLTQPAKCRSHFNPEGNRLIAQLVYDYLGREGLLPGRRTQDRRGAGTPHPSS